MKPKRWFKIEAEPPNVDDPYPSESWVIKTEICPLLGGVTFHDSLEKAIDYLKGNGYLE